jgi:acetylornithine deacetylase/succinyl-diaminopimelate desuccinylase-like protein
MLDETGLIAFTQELVRRKSLSCGEAAVARLVSERMSALGFDEVRIDDHGTVIGEATHLNLNRGQRRRGEVELITIGRPAHSANPQVGVNAAKKMIRLFVEETEGVVLAPIREVIERMRTSGPELRADEDIEVEQLTWAARGFAAIAREMLGGAA